MWLLNFGSLGEQSRVLFLQSIPQSLDRMNLFTYDNHFVIMNVVFLRALLAIVRLGLILRTVRLFAEKDHLVLSARTIRHDFNLEKVRQSYLGATRLNHISFS